MPFPLVVYASYRVCLTVMLRRAARMSSWAVPSGRPSLGRRLSYRSGVSWAPIRGRLSVSIPPALLRVDRWPSVRDDLVFDPFVRSHFGPVAARAVT